MIKPQIKYFFSGKNDNNICNQDPLSWIQKSKTRVSAVPSGNLIGLVVDTAEYCTLVKTKRPCITRWTPWTDSTSHLQSPGRFLGTFTPARKKICCNYELLRVLSTSGCQNSQNRSDFICLQYFGTRTDRLSTYWEFLPQESKRVPVTAWNDLYQKRKRYWY